MKICGKVLQNKKLYFCICLAQVLSTGMFVVADFIVICSPYPAIKALIGQFSIRIKYLLHMLIRLLCGNVSQINALLSHEALRLIGETLKSELQLVYTAALKTITEFAKVE